MKGVRLEFNSLKMHPRVRSRPEGTFRRCRSLYMYEKHVIAHLGVIYCLFLLVGCPSLLYVVGAYPFDILSHNILSRACSPENVYIFSLLLSFDFLLIFVPWNFCPRYHLFSVAYATSKQEAENPDLFHSPIGSKPN